VGQMTSYSKVFKASYLTDSRDVKVVTIPVGNKGNQVSTSDDSIQAEDVAVETQMVDKIIQDAQLKAQEIILKAKQTVNAMINDAEEKMGLWWEENEKKLEILTQEARENGFQEGMISGKKEVEEKVYQEYKEKIGQVQDLLENAYKQKETIILEAEPFLLELSNAIASQIIKQELESYPDKFVELIKQHILRFKEKDFITICVHPMDFDYIQSQRSHLLAVVNGETEIKIVPDHSVTEKGCIIRTAYGSVDARIDTQIEEIKKVIQDARRVPEGEFNS
jgi:flagellar assembly protein FliH